MLDTHAGLYIEHNSFVCSWPITDSLCVDQAQQYAGSVFLCLPPYNSNVEYFIGLYATCCQSVSVLFIKVHMNKLKGPVQQGTRTE